MDSKRKETCWPSMYFSLSDFVRMRIKKFALAAMSSRSVISNFSGLAVLTSLALPVLPQLTLSAQVLDSPPNPEVRSGEIRTLPSADADRIGQRNARKSPSSELTSSGKDSACLLPPLTLINSQTITAVQLKIPSKVRSEYQRACAALRKQKDAEAEKHLRLVVRESPKYSTAWVTLGQLLTVQKRTDEARHACALASDADPKYVPAYLCLADIAARSHDWDEVLKLSQRAIELDPVTDAIAYEYKAAANLHLHQLTDAEKSGLRAVDLDPDHREPRVYFLLAQIYEAKGDSVKEVQGLYEYLKYADNPEDIAAVKTFLATLETPVASPKVADGTVRPSLPQPLGLPTQSWGPPDVDQVLPAVHTEVSCPLPQILKETSRRAEELIENLQRFSADERIELIEVDKNGKRRSTASQLMNYVAEVRTNSAGYPSINEYRATNGAVQKTSVIDTGSAAFALIFHATHESSFEFRCEGLAQLEGSPAWQLHFEESADPYKSFHAIRIGNSVYTPRLKGRAWIAMNTYEVVRIETDLVSPISQINFNREHLVISYAPVEFKNHSIRLWLPESAALYIAYRSHRYERIHTFSHFRLFSVDSAQAVKEPTAPPQPVPPADATSQLLPVQSKLLADGTDLR